MTWLVFFYQWIGRHLGYINHKEYDENNVAYSLYVVSERFLLEEMESCYNSKWMISLSVTLARFCQSFYNQKIITSSNHTSIYNQQSYQKRNSPWATLCSLAKVLYSNEPKRYCWYSPDSLQTERNTESLQRIQ